ncbi:MAG: substrate-binding domain-containing protein [Ruminococcus sp.]|nr:substrate-binding domain-containing protein [Ruminococcus sp.]
MDSIGKIGLIMPEIIDPLDYELIQGVHQQAEMVGLDVICFTGIFNSYIEHQQDNYIHALENIYTLICKVKLDGILFAAEYFRNKPLINKIFDYLLQTGVPCLSLGNEQSIIPFMQVEQRKSMYEITRHLICVHGCRRIYCITGTPHMTHSEERLAGFNDAMQEAGLKVRKSDIFYGYFWTIVPEQIADSIASGELEMPDGIVCASDVMAGALIDRLREHGVQVPEDILVTGYDGGVAAFINSITTVTGRDRQFGADAVCRLYEMIFHKPCQTSDLKQHIVVGKSCGCINHTTAQNVNSYMYDTHLREQIMYEIEKKNFMATNVIGSMSNVQSIEDWMHNASQITHVLFGWKWLDVCLCEDWRMDFENPELYRQLGYSDNMHLVLSRRRNESDTERQLFPTQQIIPALAVTHSPKLIVLTSLHYEGQILGYISSAYQKVSDIHMDISYINWCDALANGLNILQKKQYREYIHQKMELLSVRDPLTGLYNRRGLEEQFPDFLHICRNNHKTPILLLLTYVGKISSEYDITILSDSLKKVLDTQAVLARIHEEIFAVLIPCQDSIESIKNDIQFRIEENLNTLLVNGIRPPQIIPYVKRLKCEKIDEIEEEIEQAIQAANQHIYALEKQYVDYKNQLRILRREMQTAPQNEWSIDEITKKIGISRSHLKRLYKEMFQISIIDDLIEARIEKAKQFLAHTHMRVTEIAMECGYKSETHFMRQFKDKIGITPTQYRKQFTK